MREHFGAVEADFQAYYGLDLRAVLWGPERFGARRIWSLLIGLPHDSAMVRAALYGGRPWSNTDELLATLVEAVDQGNRLFYGANRAKTSPAVWEPVQIDRPWKDAPLSAGEETRFATPNEMREVFGNNIIHDYTPGPREGEE